MNKHKVMGRTVHMYFDNASKGFLTLDYYRVGGLANAYIYQVDDYVSWMQEFSLHLIRKQTIIVKQELAQHLGLEDELKGVLTTNELCVAMLQLQNELNDEIFLTQPKQKPTEKDIEWK